MLSGRDAPFRSEVQPTPHQAQTWHSWHSLQDKSWAMRDLSVGRSNGEAMLNVAYTYIQYIIYIYTYVYIYMCVCVSFALLQTLGRKGYISYHVKIISCHIMSHHVIHVTQLINQLSRLTVLSFYNQSPSPAVYLTGAASHCA